MAQRRKPQSLKQFAPGNPEGNPVMFLDIAIGSEEVTKRVHIELLASITPKTCENFRQLCVGIESESSTTEVFCEPIGYRGTKFHRIIPGFMMQGGDITRGNGTGGRPAASGRTCFRDENFQLKHGLGSVSMADQNHTNKSQFFINFGSGDWLNGTHVVFGQVLEEDLEVLKVFSQYGSTSGRPTEKIWIANAGQLCGQGLFPPPGDEQENGDD